MVRPTSPDTKERTAAAFVERLNQHQSDVELRKIQRYFKSEKGDYGEGDVFIGVRMGQVFALAKEFIELDSNEIETLLESPVHEVRAGALSIMDKQARRKRTPESRRSGLGRQARAPRSSRQRGSPPDNHSGSRGAGPGESRRKIRIA